MLTLNTKITFNLNIGLAGEQTHSFLAGEYFDEWQSSYIDSSWGVAE